MCCESANQVEELCPYCIAEYEEITNTENYPGEFNDLKKELLDE